MTRSDPSTISAATSGKAADDGSAGTRTSRAAHFRSPSERDLAAMRAVRRAHDLGAEMSEHFFGVIARRLGLDHRRLARRIQPAEQHRGFDLRRSDGRLVFDRQGLARSLQHQRQPAALGLL